MACYQPLVRIENPKSLVKHKNGKIRPQAHITSIKELSTSYEKLDWSKVKTTLIPCGQCIGCRLDYSREWANRGYLESLLHEENYFITLTYEDKHLYYPDFMKTKEGKIYYNDGTWTGSLKPRDLELFFKRLRTKIGKFSYMACGEYGSEKNTERPHYHAILFGAHFEPETFYNARIINHEFYYQNKIIEECWTTEAGRGNKGEPLGFSNISEASWNTIAYTARYVTKKLKGVYADDEYCKKGKIKEFLRTSRKPAIGKEYFNLHQKEIYEDDKIIIHNKGGTQETRPPKYFDKLYEQYNEEDLEWIKAKRQYTAQEKQKIKDTLSSLTREEQMQVEERSKKPQMRALKRGLEMQKG